MEEGEGDLPGRPGPELSSGSSFLMPILEAGA